jgi:hypothetical protein
VRYIRSLLGLQRLQTITDEELDQLVIEKKQHFANLMGYRRLTHFLKSDSFTWVTHRRVATSLHRVDRSGVEDRKNRRLKRRIFHAAGPNQVWSCDGHDKLLRFGFAIHGGIDVFSRCILWLRVGISNKDPETILAYYLDALKEHANSGHGMYYICYLLMVVSVPAKIRTDFGSETYDLYAAQTALHQFGNSDPNASFSFGKSTHNQRIESLWSQFIRQYEQRWRDYFHTLEHNQDWRKGDQNDEAALLYVYMPILREEISRYRTQYNSHYIRKNNRSRLPYGPPEDNYFLVSQEMDHSLQISSLAPLSLRDMHLSQHDPDLFLPARTMQLCNQLLHTSPYGEQIDIWNASEQYMFLRDSLKAGEYIYQFPLLLPPKNKEWISINELNSEETESEEIEL